MQEELEARCPKGAPFRVIEKPAGMLVKGAACHALKVRVSLNRLVGMLARNGCTLLLLLLLLMKETAEGFVATRLFLRSASLTSWMTTGYRSKRNTLLEHVA